MILTYHHVGDGHQGRFWVSEKKFLADMLALRPYQVVFLSEYDPRNAEQLVVTFDDAPSDLLTFALPLLKKLDYKFEVFVIANRFEQAQLGKSPGYLDQAGLAEVIACGGRLQYHSKSHPPVPSLTAMDEAFLPEEIVAPEELTILDPRGFTFFSYPHHRHNDAVRAVTARHYRGAVAGPGGDDSPYALRRITITEGEPLAGLIRAYVFKQQWPRLARLLKRCRKVFGRF